MTTLSFELTATAPLRLDLTVWALRRRPHNLVDRWDGGTYRRVLMLQGRPVAAAVRQHGPPQEPRLAVEAQGPLLPPEAVPALKAALTRILGLEVDLTAFYAWAREEPRLGPLVERLRGVKPPRFPTVFEALVNGIACQQLSLDVGIHLLNRLAGAWGQALPGENEQAFPRPEDLAGASPDGVRSLGFSQAKARALLELAQAAVQRRFNPEELEGLDDAGALVRLQRLRGVGRWTGEYVLLRGLGRWHIFPGDDVGARNRLQRWLHLTQPLDYEGVKRVTAAWHPYGGLVYLHFLLQGLAAAGHLAGVS